MRPGERLRRGVPVAALLALGACGREPPPPVTERPPAGAPVPVVRTTDLVAGPPRPFPSIANPYQGDENATADGGRYYGWFNCGGCHGAAGGGGIGPPLADRDWIYGGEPANIFQSIQQGRPNGMPTYAGQVTDEQIWKIVAFVQSLAHDGKEGGESGSVEGRGEDRRGEVGGGDAH
jgi:cytochrome c oxidase cbb3-type subunit III